MGVLAGDVDAAGLPSQFANPFTSRVSLNAGPSTTAAPSHGQPVYTPGASSANGSSSAGAVVAGTAAVAAAGFACTRF